MFHIIMLANSQSVVLTLADPLLTIEQCSNLSLSLTQLCLNLFESLYLVHDSIYSFNLFYDFLSPVLYSDSINHCIDLKMIL